MKRTLVLLIAILFIESGANISLAGEKDKWIPWWHRYKVELPNGKKVIGHRVAQYNGILVHLNEFMTYRGAQPVDSFEISRIKNWLGISIHSISSVNYIDISKNIGLLTTIKPDSLNDYGNGLPDHKAAQIYNIYGAKLISFSDLSDDEIETIQDTTNMFFDLEIIEHYDSLKKTLDDCPPSPMMKQPLAHEKKSAQREEKFRERKLKSDEKSRKQFDNLQDELATIEAQLIQNRKDNESIKEKIRLEKNPKLKAKLVKAKKRSNKTHQNLVSQKGKIESKKNALQEILEGYISSKSKVKLEAFSANLKSSIRKKCVGYLTNVKKQPIKEGANKKYYKWLIQSYVCYKQYGEKVGVKRYSVKPSFKDTAATEFRYPAEVISGTGLFVNALNNWDRFHENSKLNARFELADSLVDNLILKIDTSKGKHLSKIERRYWKRYVKTSFWGDAYKLNYVIKNESECNSLIASGEQNSLEGNCYKDCPPRAIWNGQITINTSEGPLKGPKLKLDTFHPSYCYVCR